MGAGGRDAARGKGCPSCVLAESSAVTSAHAQSTEPAYGWGGFYIGAHLGGALELTDIGDPFGASIYGDTVRAPGPLAGGQAGYNWQHGRGLFGLEVDANWADLFGTETCFAYSGFYVSANCRADIDAVGTFAARLGWLVGPDAGTLLYGKAGGAWSYSSVDATTNGDAGFPTTDTAASTGDGCSALVSSAPSRSAGRSMRSTTSSRLATRAWRRRRATSNQYPLPIPI